MYFHDHVKYCLDVCFFENAPGWRGRLIRFFSQPVYDPRTGREYKFTHVTYRIREKSTDKDLFEVCTGIGNRVSIVKPTGRPVARYKLSDYSDLVCDLRRQIEYARSSGWNISTWQNLMYHLWGDVAGVKTLPDNCTTFGKYLVNPCYGETFPAVYTPWDLAVKNYYRLHWEDTNVST